MFFLFGVCPKGFGVLVFESLTFFNTQQPHATPPFVNHFNIWVPSCTKFKTILSKYVFKQKLSKYFFSKKKSKFHFFKQFPSSFSEKHPDAEQTKRLGAPQVSHGDSLPGRKASDFSESSTTAPSTPRSAGRAPTVQWLLVEVFHQVNYVFF